MLKKELIQFLLITVLLVISMVLLRSSIGVKQKSACKESTGECAEKRDTRTVPGMIWEPLSHQFFSFILSSY
jgi:hypothetical protein